MTINMKKKFQKKLRKESTDAEGHLWFHLRGRRFQNYKFRRQHIIQSFIVDFICLEKNLIIELDGSQHFDAKNYDEARTKVLKQEGFHVIRFWNNDVLQKTESVLTVIYQELQK